MIFTKNTICLTKPIVLNMKHQAHTILLLCSVFLLVAACQNPKQANRYAVPELRGAMKNVMRKGQLYATINLDTLSNKQHLYGIGPMEYLKGEIMLWDGHAYAATICNDSSITVKESYNIKAPFFAYTHIVNQEPMRLPDSVKDLASLEGYLVQECKDSSMPYFFCMEGQIDSAHIHVMNLPEGTKVNRPEDAQQGRRSYSLKATPVYILGFFSLHHKTIFTHHDTFLHLHLMSRDKKWLGHLDALYFKAKQVKMSRGLQ
jgi:acetolactate decarboxylase